ncbi:MAG: hypothetical protein SFW08_11525 [Gemmatimonadaceae bacterium]|nr:hypothetical protein [Gemmatimonadaceae bacterium]
MDGALPESPPRLWSHLPAATRRLMAGHIVVVIVGGLAIDRAWGWTGQHLATVWTLGVLAWLIAIGRRRERRALGWCIALAGFGEVVLSLGWQVYDYQFGNLPAFVPPGHALLMTLGVLVQPLVRARHVALVSAAATLWGAAAMWRGTDEFGAGLALVFLLCVAASRGRALYAAMFVLALLMELYGTALGNWAWRAIVPGTGWSAANPPFAAGAFYALLDLLVLALVTERQHQPTSLELRALEGGEAAFLPLREIHRPIGAEPGQ